VNPTHGRALSGATAALSSVARIDFSKAAGGASFILDLHPTAVDGEEGPEKLMGLLRGFFDQGGLQIGLNVVREDQLRKAQAEPEQHGHVMVRVFGFSTQFVSLDRELQEHVIEKTKHRT
jgi:formate C-acetyltransferase